MSTPAYDRRRLRAAALARQGMDHEDGGAIRIVSGTACASSTKLVLVRKVGRGAVRRNSGRWLPAMTATESRPISSALSYVSAMALPLCATRRGRATDCASWRIPCSDRRTRRGCSHDHALTAPRLAVMRTGHFTVTMRPSSRAGAGTMRATGNSAPRGLGEPHNGAALRAGGLAGHANPIVIVRGGSWLLHRGSNWRRETYGLKSRATTWSGQPRRSCRGANGLSGLRPRETQ